MAAQQPSGPIMQEAVGTEVVALSAGTNETPSTEAENSSTSLLAEFNSEHRGGNPPSQSAPGHVSDAAERDSDTSQGEDHWVCWSCGAQGHPSWLCPVTPMVLTCSHCHRHGHSAAQCLTPTAWDYSACFECGELGHFAKHCPLRSLVWGTWRNCSVHHIPRGICNMYIGGDGRPRCTEDTPCTP